MLLAPHLGLALHCNLWLGAAKVLCQHCIGNGTKQLAEKVLQVATNSGAMMEVLLCGFCHWYYTLPELDESIIFLQVDREMCEGAIANAADK